MVRFREGQTTKYGVVSHFHEKLEDWICIYEALHTPPPIYFSSLATGKANTDANTDAGPFGDLCLFFFLLTQAPLPPALLAQVQPLSYVKQQTPIFYIEILPPA